MKPTPADKATHWIQQWCVHPNGPQRGKPVCLTPAERETIRQIYDNGETPTVDGVLAAYLALFHICGPNAVNQGDPLLAKFRTDIFTMWHAVSPDMREFVQRHGDHIACGQLGTRWPAVA